MPVSIPLQPDEKLLFHETFTGERQSFPFVFAASREAIYVSREKHLALESWCYERFPVEQVRRVVLKREPRWKLLAAGAAVFFAGLALGVLQVQAALMPTGETKTIYVLPYVMMFFGLAMPFLARKRRVLVIEKTKGRFKWKPKVQLDGAHRAEIETLQQNILSACASVGVHVAED